METGLDSVWPPYTQVKTTPSPHRVVGTDGCRIRLADGRELIDGVASWWSCCHGYNHPHLIAAVRQQLEVMPHVMFGGLVHEPALRLGSRLCNLTGLDRVFFSDSGSVAVEVALKLALQYWRNVGQPARSRFACFSNGYHGDTIGAMSVSDPEQSMHRAFRDAVAQQYVFEIPAGNTELQALDTRLSEIGSQLAGMIIEPLVQCAGGMKFHSAETLRALQQLAHKHGLLFIADEIATGFGRTGTLLACQQADILPDILCLGKALTGGAIALGATIASGRIFDAFLDDREDRAFMHGPTFMANALACAAANASLDLFEEEPRIEQVIAIEAQLQTELAACQSIPGVIDVRVKGAIGVVELSSDKMDTDSFRQKFVNRGVWIRPLGNVVYLMPPFIIDQCDLRKLTESVVSVLKE
ncbi:MAG: adenosylmethionine--8-amino-7-oxononanoate transaminase [Pirellulales bacterium]|nr:adenosylmethionine--8-amino-7-oxononanoate transaminase [Pirellulales bacterium]